MKKLILSVAVAALALPSAALAAPAGSGASLTGQASAEVVAPLHIECLPMHWGQFSPQHSAAFVTLDADGDPLYDPSNISVPGSRSNAEAGHCDVIGQAGLSYQVTLPTTETLTSGANTMTMTNFIVSTDLDGTPSDPLSRTLANIGGVGKNGFGVGAQLNVGADQPAGLYQGTYTVSVQYN